MVICYNERPWKTSVGQEEYLAQERGEDLDSCISGRYHESRPGRIECRRSLANDQTSLKVEVYYCQRIQYTTRHPDDDDDESEITTFFGFKQRLKY